jgi:hypothetical protein
VQAAEAGGSGSHGDAHQAPERPSHVSRPSPSAFGQIAGYQPNDKDYARCWFSQRWQEFLCQFSYPRRYPSRAVCFRVYFLLAKRGIHTDAEQTTKSLFVGHLDYKYLRYQVIDTPGMYVSEPPITWTVCISTDRWQPRSPSRGNEHHRNAECHRSRPFESRSLLFHRY